MDYSVLGELRATEQDEDRTPRGQRARDLLGLLLVRSGQSVDAQVLLDLVWGKEALGLDVSVVHTNVLRLRRRLGDGQVETTRGGYRLRHGATDSRRFTDLVTQTRELDPGPEAIEMLREALGLWRGEQAFADVTEDLVAAEASRLRERRSAATARLTAMLLDQPANGHLEEAVLLSHDFVMREPLLERAHALMMLALWRSGRQAEAIASYEQFRLLLRDELGVDPSPETSELHYRMLVQDPTLDVALPRSTPRRNGPPAATTDLVGRRDELARLRTLVAARRLVVVIGPGGVGKSRLLAELHATADPHMERTWVDLASEGAASESDLLETVAHNLGVRLPADDPLDALVSEIGGSDLLLMLDEAERSAEVVASVIGDLVARCPQLRVVASSRTPLGVTGETTLVVEPLPLPDAVAMLRARVLDHAPDLALDDTSLERLASRVDGPPLALELLAGYAGTHSAAELELALEAQLDLTSTEAGRPDRHRSLRETILWSVDRVPADARAVLRRLGIFEGSFDLVSAYGVVGPASGDVAATIRSLARDGLVQVRREGDGLTLRLLTAVRDLALAGLSERGELEAARARHRRWHADRWRGALRSDALLDDVGDHYPDYLAALRSSIDDHDVSTIGALAATLSRYWVFHDMVATGARWLGEVLADEGVDALEHARLRTMRASLTLHHTPQAALADAAHAAPVLAAERDYAYLVNVSLTETLVRAGDGDFAAAVSAAGRAVAAADHTTGERQADALGTLAFVQSVADPEGATETIKTAWARVTTSRSAAARTSVASNLSLALLQLGRIAEARRLLEEAKAELGELPVFAVANLAWVELVSGNPRDAAGGFSRVAIADGPAPADRGAAEVLAGLGCAWQALGRPAAAEMLAGAAELGRRTHLHLMPFQATLVSEATELAGPWDGVAWPDESGALGARLSRLIAGDDAVSGR